MKKLIVFTLLLVIVRSLVVFAATPVPVLCFSDLVDGPKTGWEESPTKGCAVTIWGRNFGSIRAANYVTVCGTDLRQNSDYAEWGETAGNAVDLERITFWLNSDCSDGTGIIKVTVNGISSNSLPFTVRDGNIYFVAKSDGNNENNGRYGSFRIGNNGSWETIAYARRQISGGDIVYIRSGIYDEHDLYGAILYLYPGFNGSVNRYTGFVGYPSEMPILDAIPTAGGAAIRNNYSNTGYTVIAKLKILACKAGIVIDRSNVGHYRIIALEIDGQKKYPLGECRTGAIKTDCVSHFDIFGCHIYDWGHDKYDHGIYAGTYECVQNIEYYDIGWNEFHDLGPDVSGIYIHPRDTDVTVPKKYADEINIHNNLCYSLECSGIHISSRVEDIRIYNNIIYNCGSAFSRSPVYFTIQKEGTPNILFYNNTVYSFGSLSMINFKKFVNITMKNNIIYSLGGTAYYSDNEYIGTRTSNYDVWYGNDSPPSWATNVITEDPLFVDSERNDFRLKDESPARDRGTFAVSSIVSRDFDGVLRTPNPASRYDIGAYEWAEDYLFLASSLSNVKVFPNPFKPSKGDSTIKFINLRGNPEIKIYTVSGELVKKITKEEIGNNSAVEWNVKNSQGEGVVSGVYVYLVTNEQGAKKYGKFSIIK